MAGFDLNSLLNGKSKGAAVKENDTQAAGLAEGQGTPFKVVMLDVEDLMPSKDNFYTTEGINELADAIELSGGIEQNLVVKPEAHGKYEVIAGHRRRLAALKLIGEGKEEYRKVPCRIKYESDTIKDKLSLILTNSTARELTDWEKVKQAKELKELLTEYKKALMEENKDKPKEERVRMGRIREIVAQMLNTSTTQIGRMEAIDNNLSPEFKQELEKGNIGISTAHELSRLNEQEQAKAYQQYEEKGEMHIKDVKQEQKEEITDEQVEQARKAIIDAIKGEANRAVFNAKGAAGIEKAIRKHFEKTFKGSKINLEDGRHFIYRFSAEGLTIINEEWQNYVIEYADLAEIVELMIESGDLIYDDTPEEVQDEQESTEKEAGGVFSGMNEPQAAGGTEEEDNEPLPGQQDMSDYPEYVPEPEEKGLSFTEWIQKKYGTGQYNLIQKVVRDTILAQAEKDNNICPKEWESRLTNALSVWVMGKTKEYQTYLQG